MVKFIDPQPQYHRIRERLAERFERIHRHSAFIMGPEVGELEGQLSHYLGAKHAIACANGTDALTLALMALKVGEGDEVICPDFSFFATSECISLLKARPVFVDIDPRTYNLDPRQLARQIGAKTAAVIAVSLYGQCADYDEINAICERHRVPVIEDAAQSFGATYKGRKSCHLTTLAVTSFYPTKPLAAYGNAGALFTDCSDLAQKLRKLRDHGAESKYLHTAVGMNSRMDSYQAAVLLEKLALFDEEVERRQEVAGRYHVALQDCEGVDIPFVESHNRSVYAQYTIRVRGGGREQFIRQMQQRGLPVMIHYPRPLSRQPVYLYRDREGERGQHEDALCPESLKAANEVASLPFHPYLSQSDQELVSAGVRECMARGSKG